MKKILIEFDKHWDWYQWHMAWSSEVIGGFVFLFLCFFFTKWIKKELISTITTIVRECNENCARNVIAKYRMELKKQERTGKQ